MCGIAGFEIDGRDVPQTSAILANALSSRGPDASWAVVRGATALVNTRLAVIDLSDAVVLPDGERAEECPPRLQRRPATDLWMLATLIAWEQRLKAVRSSRGAQGTNRLDASSAWA